MTNFLSCEINCCFFSLQACVMTEVELNLFCCWTENTKSMSGARERCSVDWNCPVHGADAWDLSSLDSVTCLLACALDKLLHLSLPFWLEIVLHNMNGERQVLWDSKIFFFLKIIGVGVRLGTPSSCISISKDHAIVNNLVTVSGRKLFTGKLFSLHWACTLLFPFLSFLPTPPPLKLLYCKFYLVLWLHQDDVILVSEKSERATVWIPVMLL